MPGSETDAFKGVSVFLGLMLTLGSSGLVNQIVSGFTVTYSRAMRLGDFVRIGDVEGTVIHLGMLSTKIKTLQLEEVTIPNAVVASQTATDYSRFADMRGRVHAHVRDHRLRRAVAAGAVAPAARRRTNAGTSPATRRRACSRTALQDFYVKYTLLGVAGAPGVAARHAQRAPREHPGSVQRVRRADHVTELPRRSRGAEGGREEGLVCGAGDNRSGRRNDWLAVLKPRER